MSKGLREINMGGAFFPAHVHFAVSFAVPCNGTAKAEWEPIFHNPLKTANGTGLKVRKKIKMVSAAIASRGESSGVI